MSPFVGFLHLLVVSIVCVCVLLGHEGCSGAFSYVGRRFWAFSLLDCWHFGLLVFSSSIAVFHQIPAACQRSFYFVLCACRFVCVCAVCVLCAARYAPWGRDAEASFARLIWRRAPRRSRFSLFDSQLVSSLPYVCWWCWCDASSATLSLDVLLCLQNRLTLTDISTQLSQWSSGIDFWISPSNLLRWSLFCVFVDNLPLDIVDIVSRFILIVWTLVEVSLEDTCRLG